MSKGKQADKPRNGEQHGCHHQVVLHEASPTSTCHISKRELLYVAIIQDESHPAYQENDKQMTVEILEKVYASLHGIGCVTIFCQSRQVFHPILLCSTSALRHVLGSAKANPQHESRGQEPGQSVRLASVWSSLSCSAPKPFR